MIEVRNPYNEELVCRVEECEISQIPGLIEKAEKGFARMREMSVEMRAEILKKAAAALLEQKELFAGLLVNEVGKVISDARKEVERAANTLRLSGEAVYQVCGEVIPIEHEEGRQRIGFYKRVPVGVVLAITPFNFPLNLACHKVGPALAAGNAVIVKPASKTPLTVIKLRELLIACGLPEEVLCVVCGPGETLGNALVTHPAIRKISFTGSCKAGEEICKNAGIKRITMELGSTGAVVVSDRTDIREAARKLCRAGFANAGQVCISVQRVYVQESRKEELIGAMEEYAKNIIWGDPAEEGVQLGPMISHKALESALEKVRKSLEMGAELVTGNTWDKNILHPTILRDVPEEAPVIQEEVFAPVIAVNGYRNLEEAIAKVNGTAYGLQAGIFTESIEEAMKFTEEVDCGGVIINDTCNYRVDQMPYGGFKNSGLGKEGPGFAIKEMTEMKMVVVNGRI